MILMALLLGVQSGQQADEHQPALPISRIRPAGPVPASPTPPPPVTHSRKPVPITPPQSWVTRDDYPAEALRNSITGTVQFELFVDDTGKPYACTVRVSSGSALLDQRTCELMRQRARFLPALDHRRRPVAATFIERVIWKLPEQPSLPIASWAMVLRATVGEDGALLSCTEQGFDLPAPLRGEDGCKTEGAAVAKTVQGKLRGAARGPIRLIGVQEQLVDGKPFPTGYVRPSELRTYGRITLQYAIATDGTMSQCHVEWLEGAIPPVPEGSCAPLKFAPETDAAKMSERYQAHFTILYLSDGQWPDPETKVP